MINTQTIFKKWQRDQEDLCYAFVCLLQDDFHIPDELFPRILTLVRSPSSVTPQGAPTIAVRAYGDGELHLALDEFYDDHPTFSSALAHKIAHDYCFAPENRSPDEGFPFAWTAGTQARWEESE